MTRRNPAADLVVQVVGDEDRADLKVAVVADQVLSSVGYHDIIDHGADAATARTADLAVDGTQPVLWRGSVEPTNAVDGDDWLDLP